MIKDTPLRLDRVGLIILFVKDPVKSLKFYREKLGLTVRTQMKNWIELDGGGVTLALHAHNDIPYQRSDAQPQIVFEVEDIHSINTALKEKGVKFTQELRKVHEGFGVTRWAAEFDDPDGNTLSILGTVHLTSTPRPL